MICEECKNNVDEECKICILEDGSLKKISHRQQGCGFLNKDVGFDLRNEVPYESEQELKIKELEARIAELESRMTSRG